MNKALLTFNIVLLLALGYLYYAFFSSNKKVQPVAAPQQTSKASFRIAYFDLDTLDKYYVLAKETRDYLNGKNDAMEAKLNKIRAGLYGKSE